MCDMMIRFKDELFGFTRALEMALDYSVIINENFSRLGVTLPSDYDPSLF